MQYILIIALLLITQFSFAHAERGHQGYDHEVNNIEDGSSVFTPEEEAFFFQNTNKGSDSFRFAQTKWRECEENITGNYFSFNCSNNRGVSVILKDFMFEFFYGCVDESLKVFTSASAVDLHVEHAGIQGDQNHKATSLHSEARAIDIHSFDVRLSNGSNKKLIYQGTTNREFFTKFRQCWGRVVNQNNGCPLISGQSLLTGSIGWEDKYHQNHLHVSVPYCVNGSYAGNYNRR